MGTFELIYENFRTNRNHYFILLKRSASSLSAVSRVFEGYESCKENLIYLISEKVLCSLDQQSLPSEANFLPISFNQFSEIIEQSPDESSLKIVENETLEIVISSGDVKKYAKNNTENKRKKLDRLFFCLFGVMLLCVVALKFLYFYVSYVLIFNILGMHGLFAAIANILTFILLNTISDKLLENLVRDLDVKKKPEV